MAPSAKAGSLRVGHTSDWHLGIELGTQSRRVDHEKAIASVVERFREFSPDAIVHTGDLFDHNRPGGDDQALAVDALRQLSEIAPTVVVGGNHDPLVMLDGAWGPLAALAGEGRLSFRGRLHRPEDGGVVAIPASDGSRRVLVCTVPFVTPHSFARFDRPGETTSSFTDGIKRVADAFDQWLKVKENVDPAKDKVIWAAHLLVNGAQPAGSERRIDMGDDYATSTAQIPAVSYAAFGHIHRAQALPGTITGRYAGGMLHFRFDEAREEMPEKGIVFVELPATGAPKITPVPIDTGRRLVELTERLEDLSARASEVSGCFVRVTVPLDGPMPGLRLRVADALPDAIVVDAHPEIAGTGQVGTARQIEPSSLDEMLERWLAGNAELGTDPERTAKTLRVMVGAAIAGRRIPLEEERLLDTDIAAELVRELADTTGWVDPEAEALAADLLASASAPALDGTQGEEAGA